MTEPTYDLIEVILRGGPRDGQIVKLPRFTMSIDIPDLKQFGSANLVTPGMPDISYDRYCYMEELSTDEWPVFQFQCTHHSPGQDIV